MHSSKKTTFALFIHRIFIYFIRPLTQEEIAERREIARQRLAEKQAVSTVNKDNGKNGGSKEGASLLLRQKSK